MKNRIFSLLMILCLTFSVIPMVFAEGNEIEISSEEDFIKFAKKCNYDQYSKDKIINLNCDMDFSDIKFVSVGIFGGIFNGNGHTISGIDFSEKGSYIGIFRYVADSGKVSNLNIEGNFEPDGSKSFVGGIAGENSGEIKNCSFSGNIKGENVIGGIVGSNTDSGRVISCTTKGNITGENSTGGIVGKNSGFIQNCKNNGKVNTVYEEKKKDITNIEADTGSIIDNYKLSEEENEEESILGHTDTGGIVGYTSGIVQGCVNKGNVGYNHIGYNVGGVAGRQAGYMLGNKNYGFIQGRKDVGGIVGQAEPYILLDSVENLGNLRQELTKLNNLVNDLINDSDNLGDETHKYLDNISKYAKSARENTEDMMDLGTDFIDGNIYEINAQSAIISNTIDKLEPVFDDLEKGSDDIGNALGKIADAIDEIDVSIPDLDSEIKGINSAIDEIVKSESNLRKALTQLRKSIVSLENTVEFENTSDVNKAFNEFQKAIKDMITSREEIDSSLEKIEEILKKKPESFDDVGINAKEILTIVKDIRENNSVLISSLKSIASSLRTIIKNGEIDFEELSDFASYLKSSIGYMSNAMYFLTRGIDMIGDEIQSISDKIGNNEENFKKAKDDLAKGIELLSYATDDLTSALGKMKDIFSDLSKEKSLEFVKLGDDFRDASSGLFDSLSGISDEIKNLDDVISSERKKIKNDLTSVSDQFNVVMNLLIDEVDSLKNTAENLSDLFLDASDEDIENVKQGKIKDCGNFGVVEADRNSGGIVGAISIEYSKDPEDELEKPDTLNFTYRTKAVVQECVNEGKITGKKDCTGGIAGLLEIGTVFECENYGDVESTSGNYVGGIAGKSSSTVRKCYSKSKIVGERYVGGVVGKGENVTMSYAIVNVSGDENVGAICGDAQKKGKIYKNYFVNKGKGGIDNISYKDIAEPVSFEKLKEINGIPLKFISFTVTFKADDKIIDVQDIKYGESTERIKYPDIPKKKGVFGKWEEVKAKTVTENIEINCEYQPYITVLSSEEKDGKLAIALAEGEFTDEARLEVLENNEKPKNVFGNVKSYDINLYNTDIAEKDNVKLRILNKDKCNVVAYTKKGDKWEKTSVAYKGKYVLLETKGIQNTIALKFEKRNKTIIILGIGAFLFAFIAFLLAVKKYKKKKSK